MIPRLDAALIAAGHTETLNALRKASEEIGFLTVYNTGLDRARMETVLDAYRRFFHLPERVKRDVDMARTGSNRGWGAPGSEQVDPDANPDYKQFFDCGFELPADDPFADLSVYAPNQWPEQPNDFREIVQDYYRDTISVCLTLLRGIAEAIGEDPHYFDDKFTRPMALLRGNFYPSRPVWAGAKDFGIATHTDYGCLTLLATDGSPGLEVRKKGGGWIPVSAPPGEFVINFGEMLEFWSGKRVIATPHRVVGGVNERISIPMFFNPNHDTDVSPANSKEVVLAGDHLSKRFNETYVHLQKADDS